MKKMINRVVVVLLAVWLLPQSVHAAQLLLPVGEVIGLSLGDSSVTVAAFDDGFDCARSAGIQIGDQLMLINGRKICSAQDVRTALEQSDGSVDVTVLRRGKEKKLHIIPEITPDGPRLGVYLKEGVTGVGTVTWYDPETGKFGALGHGVNNKNGVLLDMQQGTAYEASILSVKKGRAGAPGQLIGALQGGKKLGDLSKNTSQGVFGTAEGCWQGECLPVCNASQIRKGDATILCAVEGDAVREYSVEILKIYPAAKSAGRNMLLRVTDPALLSTTGGIVQGMSGSPLVQDGKLIGAVTHVLVNDPTMGYGIFIENMLEAAG